MPHECLQVNEIVDLTFSFVYGRSDPQPNKRDLLSLALTCHDFEDIALNILWHTQTNLVSLLGIIPEESRNIQPLTRSGRPKRSKANIKHIPPNKEQIARLVSYAGRIRKIVYVEPEIEDLKLMRRIWEMHNKGKKKPYEPIFSTLIRLEFGQYKNALDCLDFFLESSAISLSFFWANPSTDIVAIFPMIREHALNMRELDMGTLRDHKSRIDCPDLSDLVCQMTELRSISCAERLLTSTAVQHLSTLPHLRSLVTPNTSKSILDALEKTSTHSFHEHFPELRQLTMYEDDLVKLARLLGHLHPLRLRQLTVHLLGRPVPPASDIRATLTALEQYSSAHDNIRELRFKHLYVRQRISMYVTEPEDIAIIVINGSTFEPALSFRMLTTFEVDIGFVFALSDAELIAMADAWPHLRRLQLGSFSEHKRPTEITYEGILHLLKKCPKLEFLVFSFDGASAVPPEDTIPAECTNENITYIEVGRSSIGQHSRIKEVATFFKRVFPNLCTIVGGENNSLIWQAVTQEMNGL